MSKNVVVFVTIFAFVVVMGGCMRQGDGARQVDEGTKETANTTSSGDAAAQTEVPSRMVSPPEHSGPWSIEVSPEPLSPTRSANTGDYRGPWPDYRPPKAILMAAPELPPGLEGPTVDTSAKSSPAGG